MATHTIRRLVFHAYRRLPTILLIWGFLWGIAALRVLDDLGSESAVPSPAVNNEVVEEETFMSAPRVWCCRSVEVTGCERPNHVQVPAWMDPDFHPRLDGTGVPRLRNNDCACAHLWRTLPREVGWGGQDCSVPTCPNSCSGAGNCATPGICDCFVGWTGVDCRNPICDQDCGNHGDCLKPGSCHCDEFCTKQHVNNEQPPGLSGELQRDDCTNEPFQQGRVVTKSKQLKCICDKGWSSDNCATPVCRGVGASAGCGGHGTCIAPNSCRCSKGFSGPDCSVIRGNNGKFFFTSEDSKRWAQDSFAVKKEQLKAAEHDLSVAQRRAERKVVRERRVYHLPDSDSVNIDEVFNMLEDAGEIGGKKDGLSQKTLASSMVSKSKSIEKQQALSKSNSSKTVLARKIELREIARRQFPHASEQELDLLPKDILFYRGAVHSAVPDKLEVALTQVEKENTPGEPADLFWENEYPSSIPEHRQGEQKSSEVVGPATKNQTSAFEHALRRVVDERKKAKKTDEVLIEAGTSFVKAVVEAEDDITSVEQGTTSTAAAIAAAMEVADIDVGDEMRLTVDEKATESIRSNNDENPIRVVGGLFWDGHMKPVIKQTHAEKDIQDLLLEDRMEDRGDADRGKIYELGYHTASMEGEEETLNVDFMNKRRSGGSLVVTKGSNRMLGNNVKVKDAPLAHVEPRPKSLAEVHRAKLYTENAAIETDQEAILDKENHNATGEGLDAAETPPQLSRNDQRIHPVVKKIPTKTTSAPVSGMSETEKELRSDIMIAAKKRREAEVQLQNANAEGEVKPAKVPKHGSSSMFRGVGIV